MEHLLLLLACSPNCQTCTVGEDDMTVCAKCVDTYQMTGLDNYICDCT